MVTLLPFTLCHITKLQVGSAWAAAVPAQPRTARLERDPEIVRLQPGRGGLEQVTPGIPQRPPVVLTPYLLLSAVLYASIRLRSSHTHTDTLSHPRAPTRERCSALRPRVTARATASPALPGGMSGGGGPQARPQGRRRRGGRPPGAAWNSRPRPARPPHLDDLLLLLLVRLLAAPRRLLLLLGGHRGAAAAPARSLAGTDRRPPGGARRLARGARRDCDAGRAGPLGSRQGARHAGRAASTAPPRGRASAAIRGRRHLGAWLP